MKITKKPVPLYYGKLIIVVSKDFKKSLKKLDIPYNSKFSPNRYLAFVVPKKSKIYVFLKPKPSLKIIAHEAVHIVNHIFKTVHVELDIDNDEPQAYLTGWVVGKITKALK